jgi:electron transfer flavoprotein beta subunit
MDGDARIVVCVKQVPDPEGPASSYVVDEERLRVAPQGIPPVANPFDENALEAALRLKEDHGAHITLLSLGHKLAGAVFLKALATGADELVVLDDPAFDRETLDSHGAAYWLTAALRRMGVPDLILAGRQASDTNAGQVAIGVAQMLNIAAVTLARRIELVGDTARVERVLPDGYEVVYVRTPALVTVSHEVGELRYPHMADIKAAKRKPQSIWTREDMGLEIPRPRSPLIALRKPARDRECLIIAGEDGVETGRLLAERLVADKVI